MHKSDTGIPAPFAALQLCRKCIKRQKVSLSAFRSVRAHSARRPEVLCLAAASVTSYLSRVRQRWRGQEGKDTSIGHPARRVTDCLLLLNGICYAAQILSRGRLVLWGVKDNAAISAGQWWRLVTPTFLHGGLTHLLMNSYSLNAIGPFMEKLSRRRRFLAVYGAGAVGGCVLSYLRSPIASLGASAAIFGIMGAEIVFIARHRKQIGKAAADRALKGLGQILLINFLLGLSPSIDNWGHLGGILGGASAAYLLGPSWHLQGNQLIDSPPIPVLTTPPRKAS